MWGKMSRIRSTLLEVITQMELIGVNLINEANARLTLKVPITTAADDIHKYFSLFFRENKTMFQMNHLLGRGFT